jgi:hypothetical protein
MELFVESKDLAAIAVGLLAIGLLVLVRAWPKDYHHTFSQHAATNKYSIAYYITLFTVVLPLLLIYFFVWLIPTYHLPAVYAVVIIIAISFQYFCTFVPEVGRKIRWHRIFAGVSAVCLLIASLLLAFTPQLVLHERVVGLFGATLMLLVLVLAMLLKSKYAMILQIIYFASFFMPLLVIAA